MPTILLFHIIAKKEYLEFFKMYLMEVDDGRRQNIEENTTIIFGYVSQISTIYIYFAQLRDHQKNTCLYVIIFLMSFSFIYFCPNVLNFPIYFTFSSLGAHGCSAEVLSWGTK